MRVIKIFYVAALSICFTSCVSTPDKDFYQADKQPVFQKKTCISLKVLNGNATKPFSKEYLEYSTAEYSKIKFELSKYNLAFDCTGSVRNYTLITSMSLDNPFVSYPWLVISSLTLAIIPYFDTHNYELNLKEGERLVSNEKISLEKGVWLFYFFKMRRVETESIALYGTTVGRSILTRKIASMIKADIESSKVSQP
ncbi:MAG: hypothetical protein B7Y39_17025 [Bdellovibrio sp. 28-41-41]|nr:MAG: hypothetical protein B7Y39_17025 [Bdellovibrio sp. 28-41-41]